VMSPLMRIVTPPGVFRPISDTWLLADALVAQGLDASTTVLDLCTGSGAIAVRAARAGAGRVVAADLSRKAVATAQLNAIINGVGHRVRGRRTSLYDAIDGRFDFIVSNPPYVPGEDPADARGVSRAWHAGDDGRALLDPLIAGAPAHLKPGGTLLVVHSEVNGIDTTLEAMQAAGLAPAIMAEHRGPLGPLMRKRDVDLDQELVTVIGGRAAPRPSSPPLGRAPRHRPSTRPRSPEERAGASSSGAATPPARPARA
jgi:release factor glutamine methyltransferase